MKSDRTLCNEANGEERAALAIDPDSTIALNALAIVRSLRISRILVDLVLGRLERPKR